jgi:hypothetical protein
MEDEIVDVDESKERAEELLETETLSVGGVESPLGEIVEDIQNAHAEIDQYKRGSLHLAKNLEEAAEETEDDVHEQILRDMHEAAFAAYLRILRGDSEILGDREGEYSEYLK